MDYLLTEVCAERQELCDVTEISALLCRQVIGGGLYTLIYLVTGGCQVTAGGASLSEGLWVVEYDVGAGTYDSCLLITCEHSYKLNCRTRIMFENIPEYPFLDIYYILYFTLY